MQAKRVEDNTTACILLDTAISEKGDGGPVRDGTVGAPVTATDADSDLLNYTDCRHNANFSIDQKTGQIKTKVALDFEDSGTASYDSHRPTLPTPPAKLPKRDVMVTITVTDVNEAPTFTDGPEGMAADHTEGMTVIDASSDAGVPGRHLHGDRP